LGKWEHYFGKRRVRETATECSGEPWCAATSRVAGSVNRVQIDACPFGASGTLVMTFAEETVTKKILIEEATKICSRIERGA